jgi:CAAX protease family protein
MLAPGQPEAAISTMIRRYPLAAYFALAYCISWLIWLPLCLPAFGVHALPAFHYHHAFGALGPIVAAFLVSTLETGRAGTGDLLSRLFLWQGRMGWVVLAIAAPVALLALGMAGASLMGGEHVTLSRLGRSREFPNFSALEFMAYNLGSFGYGEEVGWRGFALPRLQARHSALVSALLLTVGWALWHAPLFLYRPGYVGMNVAAIAGWLFSLVTGSVLLTWLYNGSRGSLLVVAIFHAAIDVVFTSESSSPIVVNLAGALITVWGVVIVLAAGPSYLCKRGKVVRLSDGSTVTDFVERRERAAPTAG